MSIVNNNENTNVAQVVVQVLTDWLEHGGEEKGQISTATLQQAVAQSGANPADLQHVDMNQLYAQACQNAGLPAPAPYNGPAPVEHIVRQVQQVTEVNNYHTEYNDNSQNVNNNLDLHGATVDGNVDFDPVSATGGSVAGGGNVVGATNGSEAAGGNIQTADHGSTLVGGDNYGNANSGDHAAQVGGSSFGGGYGGSDTELNPVRTLQTSPLGGHDAPININTGDGAQTVATSNGGPIHFGAGDDTNVQNSTLDNSAVGHDHVFGGNTASDGSAVGDGNETQHIDDHHQETYTSTVTGGDGDHSPILVDQGHGDHTDTQSHDQHVDVDLGHVAF